MNVLGIDPGVSETGWAVLDCAASDRPRLLASGLIRTQPERALPHRLREIHAEVRRVIGEHDPDAVAIEEMFFLKAAHTVRATLQARGVILLAAAQAGKPVSEYNPRAVKLTLTGSGQAAKSQMQSAVRRLLNLKDVLRPADVADAAAIALCHSRAQKFSGLKVLDCLGRSPKDSFHG